MIEKTHGRLNQINGRLRAGKVGVRVEIKGNFVYLRATLPPKPGDGHTQPYQQRIALGVHANFHGLQLAEQKAREVGAALDGGKFRWDDYVKNNVQAQTVGDWTRMIEHDYFSRRERNPKSETTWKGDYADVYRRLPQDEPLTVELILEAIAATEPDTRSRKRFVMALAKLAEFAGIEANFKHLKGRYSPQKVNPRNLPSDAEIAEWRERIDSPEWQRVYGLMATYGLRPHEVFHLDFSQFPVLLVEDDTKTGQRRAMPFYPEWSSEWFLLGDLPTVTGNCNRDLGNRVSHAFERYGIPFHPYDLRHAWAVRTIQFGVPDSLACRWMGNSVEVFTKTYQQWIRQDVETMVYQTLTEKSDRPHPPGSDRVI